MNEKKIFSVRKVVLIGMFGALAAVLMLFEFPIPFIAPSFYEMDLSEIPVLVGTFSMGPIAGILIELIKILLKLLLKGTSTAYVGDFANFCLGCCFLIPAGIIYHVSKSKKHAIMGMAVGTIVMAIMGTILNAFVLLPFFSKFYGIPFDTLIQMGTAVNGLITDTFTFVLIIVAPFNIIKGFVVSLITTLIYKRIRIIIK